MKGLQDNSNMPSSNAKSGDLIPNISCLIELQTRCSVIVKNVTPALNHKRNADNDIEEVLDFFVRKGISRIVIDRET